MDGTSPEAILWPTTRDRPADIAVLCVHGIGMQEEGEALVAAAKPLLEALAGEDGVITYGETALKPRRLLIPEPAHLSAAIVRGDSTVRVILAESWWARAFDPPSYWHLLSWLLSYGTWIAIRHTVFRLSAPVRALERWCDRRAQDNSQPKRRRDWLDMLDTFFAYPGAFLSIFVVAIPLQILLLATGLLAVIPLRITQQAANRVALAISSILGDASVFTTNVAIRQAILSRVRADLECVQARSKDKTVVVLAHSQGAAVVFALLRSIADLGRIRLITYGAGIRKLSELEWDADRKPMIVRMCAALWWLGLLAALMAWQAARYNPESFVGITAPGNLLVGYLMMLLSLFVGFYQIARSRDPKIDALLAYEVRALLAKGLQWADLYASSDPVPGGPLLGDHPLPRGAEGWQEDRQRLPGFRSRQVINRMSAVADHTAYWETPNDFVPAVADQIRTWLDAGAAAPRLRPGRRRRMIARRMAGLLLAATAVALYLRAGNLLRDAILLPAWNVLPIAPSSVAARTVERFQLRNAVFFGVGLAVYLGLVRLYARRVLDPAWNAWERTVQRQRPRSLARASARREWMARALRDLGSTARMVVCAALVVVPLWLFIPAVRGGDYGVLTGMVVVIAESGVYLSLGLILVAVIAGTVLYIRDWLSKK